MPEEDPRQPIRKDSVQPITDSNEDALVAHGARVRGSYLLQQGNVTLKLAADEGASLAALLPKDFLSTAEAARLSVECGIREFQKVDTQAHDATHEQNEALRRTREWKRKLKALGSMARRAGVSVPDALTVIGKGGRSVPQTLEYMEKTIGILEGERAGLERFPLYAIVLREGGGLKETLATVDAGQEFKRLKELPDAVRRYYAAKGLLYEALQTINDAGRALYAADTEAAGRFNLAILYRNTGRGKGDDEDDEQPPAEPPPQGPDSPAGGAS